MPSLSRQESGCTPARASAFTSPTPEWELQHHPPLTRQALGRREPRAREDRDEGLHVVLRSDLAAVLSRAPGDAPGGMLGVCRVGRFILRAICYES